MDDETLRDLLQDFGPVSIRRMFGGKGIYHQGLIFALVVRDELLFRQTNSPLRSSSMPGPCNGPLKGARAANPLPCLIGACRAKLSTIWKS